MIKNTVLSRARNRGTSEIPTPQKKNFIFGKFQTQLIYCVRQSSEKGATPKVGPSVTLKLITQYHYNRIDKGKS